MQIILCAVEAGLAAAWTTFCGDLAFVTVHHGSILDVACDAVVSPANSFGFMDGGIDAVYRDHFGIDLQRRVRQHIVQHHAGELLVGVADIVPTHNPHIPYLVVAPTMRVPMVLHDSVHAYLAARAIFLLLRDGQFVAGPQQGERIADRVTTVALPGLGTGVGQIGFNTCARQVRQAIDAIILRQYRMPHSWAEASEQHQRLYTDRPKRLQS